MIEFVYVNGAIEKELDDIFNYLHENKIDVKITDVTEL